MSWQLGPFFKRNDVNPVMEPRFDARWECPLGGELAWEAKDVFNPGAVVRDGRVNLLYRAEDEVGKHLGTSRIGLAVSSDGLFFERGSSPVLFPADDIRRHHEWEGGCEDPRVVTAPDGSYVMMYTAYDGVKARLSVATSSDLVSWEKQGLAFPEMPEVWSKSGSIVCEVVGDQMVAVEIGGKYWMYWGESSVYAATSIDLIRWSPVVSNSVPTSDPEGWELAAAPRVLSSWLSADVGDAFPESEALLACLRPRSGRFDSDIVEPGPPAVLTSDGIVLLYHGRNWGFGGDSRYSARTYCVGQALFDPLDPVALLARCTEPFLVPDQEYEMSGQVANVCFAEGLVPFEGQWWLYYGTADSKIAVATAPMAGG